MNEIEEVKQRIDIVDLIGQYVNLKKSGANYKGVCPFHQEKTPSLMVSPAKQIWKCFGCSKGGDSLTFIMEAEHLEFGDALRLLAQKAGVTLQPRTKAEYQTKDRKETLYRTNQLAAQVFHKILIERPQGKAALDYLHARKITNETIKKFKLGYAPERLPLQQFLAKHGITAGDLEKAGKPERFYRRIMFPIFDVLGNVIAFTGRILGDGEPKYLNTAETMLFNKSRILYGLNFAKGAIKQKDYVVLVEGQMDVVSLHQAGVTQTVASSGTAITETQVNILSKYTSNFLLAFDNDQAGKGTTKKVIALLLKNDLVGKVVDFTPYKDAGELFEKAPQSWAKVAKAAKEAVDWHLDQEIIQAGPIQFVENKKKVVKAMLPVLSLVTDPTRLDHYVQRLAVAISAKPESIYQSLRSTTQLAAMPSPTTEKVSVPSLTNEEQLLAIVLSEPSLLKKFSKAFEAVVYRSLDAQRIAQQIKLCYTNDTLVKNQSKFTSQVKNSLDSQLAQKIDSWQFWFSQSWNNPEESVIEELFQEKLSQLSTKEYEQQKETLAADIRRAQEQNDLNKVKELMQKLNLLTAKGDK